MFQDYKVAYLREHVKVKEAQRLSFLRESVAYLLSQSAREVPHAAGIVPFDCTALIEYAERTARAIAENPGADREADLFRRAIRRNYSAFFVKLLAHCLYHVPSVNGFLDYAPWRRGGTLYVAEDINLSVTVNTKYGVVRPIVRNPHLKDIETVAKELRDLSRRARRTDPEELYWRCAKTFLKSAVRQLDFRALGALWIMLRTLVSGRIKSDPALADVSEENKLQVSDMLGATCTLANIGMMLPGIQSVTVIVPPEVMFFGIGDLHEAPLVVDGEVKPRYVISVMATMDHRAFDGGAAFSVYPHLKRYLDYPELIYEWKSGDEI